MKSNRRKILSNYYSIIKWKEFIDSILNYKIPVNRSYICFSNVHSTVESLKNIELRSAINQSWFSVTDGMPLVIALRLLYNVKQERIAGMDFMPALMDKAEKRNESVFFYGSTNDVLNKIKDKVKTEFPRLNIAGMIAPPFRDLSQDELDKYVKIINESGAKYVFIGLGCPKQEIWMAQNSPKINALLLGVGGAFEVYCGIKKRAPFWMRKYSLEWVFRLKQDPKRLWKRYLYTNLLFSYFFVKQLILHKLDYNKIQE